jgi:uncharacterized protein with HEPN domain
MSKHEDRLSLKDMLTHAREAVELLGKSTRKDLHENRMMQLALTRLVEIVGEAANRVSPETKQRTSELPWPEIVGMRNRLIHGYDVIDLDLLYDTIKTDLPPLLRTLEGIIQEEA